MGIFLRYALYLFVLYLLLFCGGFFIISAADLTFMKGDFVILLSLFSVIALLHLYIFFRGRPRSPESSTMHTLFAVSVKFLLEMVLALIWFVVIKKTSMPSLIVFFVLYLSLTLFSVFAILKTLNNKSLKKEVLI